MDRETRKANLKKLQLPGTGIKSSQRKTRQSAKTPATSSISNYFSTPEKNAKPTQETSKEPPDNNDNDKHANENEGTTTSKPKTSRPKRTKLDAFVFKQPQTIPTDLNTEHKVKDDDFDVPEKKAKKAPQPSNSGDTKKPKSVKPSRRKKQTTIKSAFLRNEQLFAEIAAQHSAADNFDGDDVQLAIAISKSEAESKGILVVDDNGANDVVDMKDGEKDAELIRQKLEKYGFRTAEKKDYSTFTAAFMPKANNGRRQKTKWANKFTALTLRNEQSQNKKLQQKIEDLLNQQFRKRPLNAEEKHFSNYHLQSRLLKKCHKTDIGKILQQPEDDLQKPHEEYFVKELFEISKLSAGHLLKNWAAIQGRDLTPKKRGPYKEAMILKLHKVYAELEEYFKCSKTSKGNLTDLSVELETNSVKTKVVDDQVHNENPSIVCNHDIVRSTEDITAANKTVTVSLSPSFGINDYFKTRHYQDDVEGSLASDTSITSSIRNEIRSIIPPTKSLDLMQVSSTSLTLQSTQSIKSNSSQESSAPEESKQNAIKYKLPATKDLDCMQVSSISLRTPEATTNSSQKTRSNSPDLFADDSDVDMEENDNKGEGTEDVNNLSVNKASCSMDNGVTTYEIYSSDEVKNTKSLESPDPLATVKGKRSPSCHNMEEAENVIDLTQNDGGEETLHRGAGAINQSIPVVEVDLFADSPLQDESVLETDINSNSQKSKYLLNNDEDTSISKFSLSLEGDDDAINPALSKNKEDTLIFTLSSESFETMRECEDDDDDVVFKDINQTNSSLLNLQVSKELETDHEANLSTDKNRERTKTISIDSERFYECEDDDDVVFKDISINQRNSSILYFPEPKQLKTTPDKIGENCSQISINMETEHPQYDNTENDNDDDDVVCEDDIMDISINQRNSSILDFPEPKQLKTTDAIVFPHKIGQDCSQFSINMETEHQQHDNMGNDGDDDDVVLREIEMDQTNTSFLNFKGPKQLETSFHRETALETEVKSGQKSLAGNNTIFQELYNKYLGSGASTQEQKSFRSNESVLRTSFTQIIPKVVTPKNSKNETYSSFDLEMTMEHYLNNRKSISFNAVSPDKNPFPRNAGLSKSQSFTEQNVSIDLTQNEDDVDVNAEEEDEDCIVLSDDEINYSIWQANKTGKFKDDEENSESDEESMSKSMNKLLNNELTPPPATIKSLESSQNSYSDFEVKSPQTNDREHKLERSKFGILEEFSEPIDFTPNLSTPTKVLEEASFLQLPTEELTAAIKRYSTGNKSTQKFNDLLKSLDQATETHTNNFDEYDEFDYMIYQNEVDRNTSASAAELPKDFDQLMTAEISFKESQKKSKYNPPPMEIDMLEEVQSTESVSIIKPKAKTPIKSLSDPQVLTINNKTYRICSDETPKPNYAQYTESELLKELYNYGIKPLKRKQAVKMLEYIYLQTHPIVVDEPPSTDMVDFDMPSTSKSSMKSKTIVSSFSQAVVPAKPINMTPAATTAADDVVTGCGDNKLNLRDAYGVELLRYSMDLKAELSDEHYILQTNITKKTQQPLMPFHIAWYNLVCANSKLHESILMYEPIDLQEIYLFLKGLGYRYDPKDLKQFFDRRCIIFRYDLATAGGNANNKVKDNNRHVRKKKTTGGGRRKQQTVAVNIS